MTFTVLIPARLASTRLPNKPLADIAGMPMVVRVARQMDALRADGIRTVVATDSTDVLRVCEKHEIEAILTRADHLSGTDRLAEACEILGLGLDEIVVNVQGDEPLMTDSLVRAVAHTLDSDFNLSMATAAHPINSAKDLTNPNIVKVVTSQRGEALYFSRAPIPWWRDGNAAGVAHLSPNSTPLRHIGIYAYRVGFLRKFPLLQQAPIEQVEALEQLRALWHGYSIAVHVTIDSPAPGVDTFEDLEAVRQLFVSNIAN